MWDRYCAAVLDDFAWQERLSAAIRENKPLKMTELRGMVGRASERLEALREYIAVHRRWHAINELSPNPRARPEQG